MDPKMQMFVCEDGRRIVATPTTFDGGEYVERMRRIWGSEQVGPLSGEVSLYSVNNAPNTMIVTWRSQWGWEANVIDGALLTTLSSPCQTRWERGQLLDILLVKAGVVSEPPRLRKRFGGDWNVALNLISSRIG